MLMIVVVLFRHVFTCITSNVNIFITVYIYKKKRKKKDMQIKKITEKKYKNETTGKNYDRKCLGIFKEKKKLYKNLSFGNIVKKKKN